MGHMLSRTKEGRVAWKNNFPIPSFTSLKRNVFKSEVYVEVKQMKTTTEVKNVLSKSNKERSTLLLFESLVKRMCLLWSYVS